MIEVTNKLKIYEINGKEVDIFENILEVKNHWNINEFVVLNYNGITITVSAKDLREAISNATNTAKW